MDVIYTLWLRQIKRYLRARGRVIATMLQPFMFLVALGLGFAPVFRKAGEGDYFTFLAPGVIGAGILFNAVFSGSDLLWDRQFGFIKETLVAPVYRAQIMIGRAAGAASVALIQGVLVGIVCAIAGVHYVGGVHILAAIGFAAMLAFLFSLLGSALGAALDDMQGFSQVVNFVVTPIFYVSGAVFPLADQSAFIRGAASINPLTYGIDALRGALTGTYAIAPQTSFMVLGLWIVFAIILAGWSFSRIRA